MGTDLWLYPEFDHLIVHPDRVTTIGESYVISALPFGAAFLRPCKASFRGKGMYYLLHTSNTIELTVHTFCYCI